MQGPLRPIDEPTLIRVIRYALATAVDCIYLRPGTRPLLTGLGCDRELGFRQLACDDTRAIAEIVLARARVPAALREDGCEAAQAFAPLWEIPGHALVEMHVEAAPGGLALRLELLRPLEDPAEIALLEA